MATSNFYQKYIISLSKKSLIQFQTEDNNFRRASGSCPSIPLHTYKQLHSWQWGYNITL